MNPLNDETFLALIKVEALQQLVMLTQDHMDQVMWERYSHLNEESLTFYCPDPRLAITVLKTDGRWEIKATIPESKPLATVIRFPSGIQMMPASHGIKVIGFQLALAIFEVIVYKNDNDCHPHWFFGDFTSTLEVD